MLKDEKKYFKEEFHRIINKVPASKETELNDILRKLNDELDEYDFFIVNWVQSGKRFFVKNRKKLMINYVDDILDGYDKGKGYRDEHKNLIKDTLKRIVELFDNNNKTLIDRIVAILGFS